MRNTPVEWIGGFALLAFIVLTVAIVLGTPPVASVDPYEQWLNEHPQSRVTRQEWEELRSGSHSAGMATGIAIGIGAGS